MKVTYLHHSCFLVETDRFYYLFDYEQGHLPEMDRTKPIFVLFSHGHEDHFNPEIFSQLNALGMQQIRAVLSDDIEDTVPADTLRVSPGETYVLGDNQRLMTFLSTDVGVAFLMEDGQELLYHAGDLNDWVWEEEGDDYNTQMTADYRRQIQLLSQTLNGREIDTAFVVLDPRQEKDYDRGLDYFLETVCVKQVYPMHYWEEPAIVDAFLTDHPEYRQKIRKYE